MQENGEYSFGSDLDEDTYAMLSTNPAGEADDPEEIYCDAYMADKYPMIVTLQVLSAQEGPTESHQCHNIFKINLLSKTIQFV